MKVHIKGDDNATGSSRMLKDIEIRRMGHPDLTHMCAFDARGTELLSRIAREALIY